MFATIFVLQNATVVNTQMISHHFIEISFILFFHIYLNTFLTNKKKKIHSTLTHDLDLLRPLHLGLPSIAPIATASPSIAPTTTASKSHQRLHRSVTSFAENLNLQEFIRLFDFVLH